MSQRMPYWMAAAWYIGSRKIGTWKRWISRFGTDEVVGPGSWSNELPLGSFGRCATGGVLVVGALETWRVRRGAGAAGCGAEWRRGVVAWCCLCGWLGCEVWWPLLVCSCFTPLPAFGSPCWTGAVESVLGVGAVSSGVEGCSACCSGAAACVTGCDGAGVTVPPVAGTCVTLPSGP